MADAEINVDIILRAVDKGLKQVQTTAKDITKGFKASSNEAQKLIDNLDLKSTIGNDITPLNKSIGQNIEQFNKLGPQLVQTERLFGKTSTQAVKLQNQLKNVGFTAGQARKEFKQMDFGFLSLIFGGQALTRTFGGFFRSVTSGYKEIADKNDEGVKSINNVSNALAFLKFSFGEAFFENELVKDIIDSLVKSLIGLAEWANDNPTLSTFLVGITGTLAGLGLVMSTIGQAITLSMAVSALKDLSGVLKGGQLAKDITATSTGLSTLQKVGIISFGFVLLYDGITDFGNIFSEIGNSITERAIATGKLAGAGGAIGFVAGGAPGALFGIVAGASVGIVLNLLDIGWELGYDEKIISFVQNTIDSIKDKFLGLGALLNFGSDGPETFIDENGVLRFKTDTAKTQLQSVAETGEIAFEDGIFTPWREWGNETITKKIIIKYEEVGKPGDIDSPASTQNTPLTGN